MLTHYAIFEVCVRPRIDSQMRDYGNDVLASMWREFDDAHRVLVMLGVKQNPNCASLPLELAITYPDAK